MFVILTQTRLNGQQVYRTVCYGPFETAAEAHYLARECLDGEPATVIQLLPLVLTGLTSGVADAVQTRATTRNPSMLSITAAGDPATARSGG